jgi:hypothetical protein
MSRKSTPNRPALCKLEPTYNGRFPARLSIWGFFNANILKTETCWLWQGALQEMGYGIINVKKRQMVVHRFSYEMYCEPIAEGLVIDHLCRTHNCVNPDHLEAVTRGENVLRGIGIPVVNKSKTHCLNGHPFTPENTRMRTREEKGRECRICSNNRRRECSRRQRAQRKAEKMGKE